VEDGVVQEWLDIIPNVDLPDMAPNIVDVEVALNVVVVALNAVAPNAVAPNVVVVVPNVVVPNVAVPNVIVAAVPNVAPNVEDAE
jgi:hypothetical protein